jgi:hypothetical protein
MMITGENGGFSMFLLGEMMINQGINWDCNGI